MLYYLYKINQRVQQNRENNSSSNPSKLAQVLDPLCLKLTKSVSRELARMNRDWKEGHTKIVLPQVCEDQVEGNCEEVLPPVGVKRSVSHPLKSSNGQNKQRDTGASHLTSIEEQEDMMRLNYDESFSVCFEVCLYISEHRTQFQGEEEFP